MCDAPPGESEHNDQCVKLRKSNDERNGYLPGLSQRRRSNGGVESSRVIDLSDIQPAVKL